jgi:hypothetical protein
MGMTEVNQIGIVPAFLVVLAGLLALHGQEEDKGRRRIVMLFLGIGLILLLVIFLAAVFSFGEDRGVSIVLMGLLMPAIIGIQAFILLNWKALGDINRKPLVIVLLGLTFAILPISISIFQPLPLWYYLTLGVAILVIGWALGRRLPWLAVAVCVAGILYFSPIFQLVQTFMRSGAIPAWLLYPIQLFLFALLPRLMVVMAAVLISYVLTPAASQRGEVNRRIPWQTAKIASFALALITLGYMAYSIFWGSVWDQTSDGLFGVMVTIYAGPVATASGMLMGVTLKGKPRLAGFVFMLVVPLLLYQAFNWGWRVSYHEITEGRAARIEQALKQFYEREGHYPETLSALTPRDLLFIQQPIILSSEKEWCYQGSQDSYRLGAFYREYFSTPVSLRVYAAAGETPAVPWECEERLEKVKARHKSWTDDLPATSPHLATPLPEIEVTIPKTVVQPVLDGIPVVPGSWSPDSAYFVFGTYSKATRLHFLNGKTAELCTADSQFAHVDGLRDYHAWLPDGRLLFVDPSGEIAVMTPCEPEIERLTDRFPVTLSQIGAYHAETGLALLMSSDAYWIFDGNTFTLQPIKDVTPNPYDLHWDSFTWLVGGEKLAIARLNGRSGSNAGSTLYLIASDSGLVESSLFLEDDYGQRAPWIEGISGYEVLVHGSDDLLIVDYSVDPPQFTNVLGDIFDLEINRRSEMAASGSFIVQDGYYLVIRLNHPRSQATYLYNSQTGRVHIYDHEHHTLLLFPDGQLAQMPKWENIPTYRDEYDLVLIDAPEAVQPRLTFSGHSPREYAQLSIRYLTATSQIVVASAHGVSLVSLPDGDVVSYWELAGDGFSPWIMVAPDGSKFVAVKDFGGLFGPLP